MESNKLERRIRDWASCLGFRLPDGSRPPPNFFASLTTTPHRRHLWEVIIESVLPRQKVGNIRDRITFAKNVGSFLESVIISSQEIPDTCDWHMKEHDLEVKRNEKRSIVVGLEENTLTKASDLVFDICKLAEKEKQFEEINEKLLIFKLFSKREEKLVKELENKQFEVNKTFCLGGYQKLEGDFLMNINELLSREKCKCFFDGNTCTMLNKIEEMCESGVSDHYLWDEVINYKKNLLQKFNQFLLKLNSSEKDILSGEEIKIEKKINQLVMQLKQKITVNSLQVMMNMTKGRFLESEAEQIEERLLIKEPNYGNTNKVFFISPSKMNESCFENKENYKSFRGYVDLVAVKTYLEFLKINLILLKDKEFRIRRENSLEEEEKDGRPIQFILHDSDSVIGEINLIKSEEEDIEEKITYHKKKLESIDMLLKEEIKRLKEMDLAERTIEKIKSVSQKHIDVFMKISVGSFRTFENSSGRVLFECESAFHWLENYDGSLKQFFSTLLIPPEADLQKIISETSKRKSILNEITKFILKRNILNSFERKIQDRVCSIKYDSQLCEKNFEESDGILWNIFAKSEQLFKDIDFVEKVLKNWMKQPYRLMIMETLEEKSLKEYEEQYRKGKTER